MFIDTKSVQVSHFISLLIFLHLMSSNLRLNQFKDIIHVF